VSGPPARRAARAPPGGPDPSAQGAAAGGRQQLDELLDKSHEAGLKVMLDIVPNHMGYAKTDEEFAEFNPFNSTK
jgi:glycosidase